MSARDPFDRLPRSCHGAAESLLCALVAASVLLLLACGQNSPPGPIITPAPSPTISIVPYEGPVICADESTGAFAATQAQARFQLYCPTYVPDGFTFANVELEKPQGNLTGALMARATFRRDEPPGEIQFLQGQPGLAMLTELVRGKEVLDIVAYSDTPANLFEDSVLARSSEGYTQIITVGGVSTDELRRIAGGTQRVPGLAPTSTASPAAQ